MSKNNQKTPSGPMGSIGAGEKPKNFKQSFSQFWKVIKPYKFQIFISIIFASVGAVLALLTPNLIKEIGETIFIAQRLGIKADMQKIVNVTTTIMILLAISFTLSTTQGFIFGKVNSKVSKKFRQDIMQKINRMPLKYFDSHSHGDVLSRITNDIDTISQTLNQSISGLITSSTMFVGCLVMMFVNSWKLSLIAIIMLPLSLVLVGVIVKFSQKFFRNSQAKLGEINGIIEETYTGHDIVQTNNYEQRALENFEEVNVKLCKNTISSNFISSNMQPIMNFISNLSYTLVCVVGGIMSISNPIFAATVVAFVTYLRMFNNQIGMIAQTSGVMQSTFAASERVFEFLNEDEQKDESKIKKTIKNFKGNIEFKDVCFGYDKDKTIIKNFSCKIKAGQKVAIVGPTGAGKTTIVNLLMRFYDIDSGEILIDGVNVQTLNRSYVRSLFSMVLQDSWIFDGTIKENISFGSNISCEKQIKDACENSHTDHFIQSMPNGYDMMLDENTTISQGQKQLLTIARCMINDSKMIILDEATSSVDTRTEHIIQKAMDKLGKGKTSFVIAHRLSTIKNSDIILYMENGNVTEQGNHKKLMEENGAYAKLYNSQFSGDVS